MPYFNCLICKSTSYVKVSHQKVGYGKYCSRKCSSIAKRNGSFVQCAICNKLVYRSAKEQRRSKSKKYFCTKKCQTIWRNSIEYSGRNHSNWTGGEYSYRQRMLRSGQVQACSKCKSQDIRTLAVHHRDKNRQNNNLENLIWLCHNCHYLVHHYEQEAIGFVNAKPTLSKA